MQRNNNVHRINSRKNQEGFRKKILIAAAIIWIFFMLDLMFNSGYELKWMVTLMVILTIGVVVVTLVLIKPGDLSEEISEYGFWRWLFSLGNPKGSKRSKRSRGRARSRR